MSTSIYLHLNLIPAHLNPIQVLTSITVAFLLDDVKEPLKGVLEGHDLLDVRVPSGEFYEEQQVLSRPCELDRRTDGWVDGWMDQWWMVGMMID